MDKHYVQRLHEAYFRLVTRIGDCENDTRCVIQPILVSIRKPRNENTNNLAHGGKRDDGEVAEAVAQPSVNIGENHVDDGVNAHDGAYGANIHDLTSEIGSDKNLLESIKEQKTNEIPHSR